MNYVAASVIALVALLVAPPSLAQDVPEWTARGCGALGRPGVLIVIDSLEQQMATPGGKRTVGLVLDAGLLNPKGPAAGSWSRLSEALDTGPMEAINRLFGTRVVVAFSTYGLPMPGDWFIATAVTRGDANRVLKGLDAVHRGVLAGATVFSIERGAYQLCVLKQNGEGRLLVLGPGKKGNGLFADAVRGLQAQAGGEWFASAWPVEEAGGVLLRVEGSEGDASLVYGHANDAGWSGVAVAPNELPADAPTWSTDDAHAMIAGSSLGMVGSINAVSLATSPLAPFIGLNKNAARSVLGDGTCRGVVRLVTREAGPAEIALALETESSRVAETDALMSMLIAVVTGRPADAPHFAGRHPGAARSAPLGGGFSDQLGRLVLGEQPRVWWRSSDGDAADRGAFAVFIGSGEGHAGELSDSVSAIAAVKPGPLVSAGRLEPGPITGIVERAAGLERPVLEWARGVESIAWQTRPAGEDRVKAAFQIILRGEE